jgi:hypothetical protein
MSPARRRPSKDDTPGKAGGFVDFGEAAQPAAADPAVSALLGQAERRQAEARLPQREREKKRKERDKIRARRPYHTTYDIPLELRKRIKSLADAEGVPASQLAALALLRFVDDLAQGAIELSAYKSPTRSPRYEWNLVIPAEEFYRVLGS